MRARTHTHEGPSQDRPIIAEEWVLKGSVEDGLRLAVRLLPRTHRQRRRTARESLFLPPRHRPVPVPAGPEGLVAVGRELGDQFGALEQAVGVSEFVEALELEARDELVDAAKAPTGNVFR